MSEDNYIRVDHNGDVPGWLNKGPLLEDVNKSFVRLVESKKTGLEAVLKFRVNNRKDAVRRLRFYNEATRMSELSRDKAPRVLPVLEIEPGPTPTWYVMPRARLLGSVFEESTTLQEIVGHIHELATALASLAQRRIYHRDIKPDNLFWHDGGPVLADFGIAYWDGDAGTEVGEKLGPLWFMAPEMRSMSETEEGRHADVYSLAQTLSAYIFPLGKLPLPGTFRAGTEDYDLNINWTGDHDALDALEHVLEAATRNSPRDRLTIAELAEELGLWLQAARTPITRNDGFRTGWGPTDEQDRDLAETRTMLQRAGATIARTIQSPSGAVVLDLGESVPWLGDYQWSPNTPDGFKDEGSFTCVIDHPDGNRRIVLGVVLLYRQVSFIAEIQRQTPSGWNLDHGWPESDWGRVRLPSAIAALTTLVAETLQNL